MYYWGKHKAPHLDANEDARAHANRVRAQLIDYVCWYEFGHDSPMNSGRNVHHEAWVKAGSGKHGHGIGGNSYDRRQALFHDIWSDRPSTSLRKLLEWYELPYAVHSWSCPFVHYADMHYTDMHFRIIPELRNLNLGGNSEGSRIGKAIKYHVSKKVVARRTFEHGRVYCHRFCWTKQYFLGEGCVHPLVNKRKTCDCNGNCEPPGCQCIACFEMQRTIMSKHA
jgi:hypothetical protein